jgi:DNA-binding MarR family transcriptional regulator
VTAEGERAAMTMKRAVARAQGRILSALDPAERDQLVLLLDKLLTRSS